MTDSADRWVELCRDVAEAAELDVPTVSAVLLAVPVGWAKIDGNWLRLRRQLDYDDPNEGMGPLWTLDEAQ